MSKSEKKFLIDKIILKYNFYSLYMICFKYIEKKIIFFDL